MSDIPEDIRRQIYFDARFTVQNEIENYLDNPIGRNWKYLACEIGLESREIENIEARPSPAKQVLIRYKQMQPRATLQDFINIAVKMQRMDIVRLIEEAAKDGELYQWQRQDRPRNGEECSYTSSSQRTTTPGTWDCPNMSRRTRGQPGKTLPSKICSCAAPMSPSETCNQKQGYCNASRWQNTSRQNPLTVEQIELQHVSHYQQRPAVTDGPHTLVSVDITQGSSPNTCWVRQNDYNNNVPETRESRSPSVGSSESMPDETQMCHYKNSVPKELPRSQSVPGVHDEPVMQGAACNMLPGRTWPRGQGPNRAKIQERPTVLTNSQDCPKSWPQQTASRRQIEPHREPPPSSYKPPKNAFVQASPSQPKITVFLTYATDELRKKTGVTNLLDNLNKNHFKCTLDMKNKYFKSICEDRVGWLTKQFKKSDYILVCCSPCYTSEAEDTNTGVHSYNDHSLNTRYIASLMMTEHRERRSKYARFIPVVMPGATDMHVPIWMRNTLIYHWPIDWSELFRRMSHIDSRPRQSTPRNAPQILQHS
ncbi:uncharacterized protein LOC102805770 [Saccoglossus kowalevskii]|uniref:Uncharacterized protein LOC102805770 n=1 Tax=Saccoglossus kowalevskii TaxID=10224 RepID=A0ABM0ME63_SACKO|nr:PREDICTED: uncharacterized protein LOC102805770 [Saccoglossus kowalevskii]